MPVTSHPRTSLARRWALAAALVCMPGLLQAQHTTVVSGTVTVDGRPAGGALVQVTGPDERSVRSTADSAGRFRVVVRSPGPYLVSVRADGLNGASRVVSPGQGFSGTITADFQLAERVVALQPVTARVAPLSVSGSTRNIPGSREQAQLGVTLRDEPLSDDLLSVVAARKLGVAISPDGSGLSASGQPPEQTRLTLDGADAGAIALPREAVRAVNLLTSTYDVARGRFTGGLLDVQTLRGGDEWGGSLRGSLAGSRLELGGAPGSLTGPSSVVALDAGGGGPLASRRLFVYGAASLRRLAARAPWLAELDGTALQRLGLSADSVRRILDAAAGAAPVPGPAEPSLSRLASALTRVDAVLSSRHSLTLRLAGQQSRTADLQRALVFPGTESVLARDALAALAEVNSGGRRVANQLRISGGSHAREARALDPAPGGILLTGLPGSSSPELRFAGGGGAAARSREWTWEVGDQVVLRPPDGTHRVRVGGTLSAERYHRAHRLDPGTFTFESVQALAANRPDRYVRSLDDGGADVAASRAAVFADDAWTPGRVQISYGLRAERFHVSAPGQRDTAVVARFGADGGRIPSPWRLSPRVGFGVVTRMPWDRAPGARTEISGGIGHFAGVLPLGILAGAIGETGGSGTATLRCTGDAVPRAQWDEFRRGAVRPPEHCDGEDPFLAVRMARASLFAPDYGPPELWRASLGGQGVLESGMVWSLSGQVLVGTRQPAAFDSNLRAGPAFRNETEAGRPVFVAPHEIDAETGIPSFAASRLYPELGVVREATSRGRSRTVQLGAGLSHLFFTGRLGWARAELGYTWTDARETTGGIMAPGGAVATTAGSPTRLEWGRAGDAPRHLFQLHTGLIPSPRFWIGATGAVASGRPFTPMVAGDVNGDGTVNDRAFIFDPSRVQDADLAGGVRRLLADLPDGAARCLLRQTGRVSAAGSCGTSWSVSLDLNLRYAFGPALAAGVRRRATLWVVAANLPSGLDYLMHGPDGLRGWGQPATVDPVLLSVRGFDAGRRAFRYEVNPAFGRASRASLLSRAPFALVIQARVVVGADRVVQEFRTRLSADQVNAAAFTPENIRLYAGRQLPNVPAEVLALNLDADLRLTAAQGRQLEDAAARLAPAIEAIVSETVASVAREGRPSQLNAKAAADLSRRAGELRARGLEWAAAILSAEQWARLPARLRTTGAPYSPYPPEEFVGGVPNE